MAEKDKKAPQEDTTVISTPPVAEDKETSPTPTTEKDKTSTSKISHWRTWITPVIIALIIFILGIGVGNMTTNNHPRVVAPGQSQTYGSYNSGSSKDGPNSWQQKKSNGFSSNNYKYGSRKNTDGSMDNSTKSNSESNTDSSK